MNKKEIVFAAVFLVVLVVLAVPFASQAPDGLERVAEDKGFLGKEKPAAGWRAPIAAYLWPGVKNERVAVILAGAAGAVFVFGATGLFARLMRRFPK